MSCQRAIKALESDVIFKLDIIWSHEYEKLFASIHSPLLDKGLWLLVVYFQVTIYQPSEQKKFVFSWQPILHVDWVVLQGNMI